MTSLYNSTSKRMQVISCLALLVYLLFILCACSTVIGKSDVPTNNEPQASETRISAEPILPLSPESTITEQPSWETCTVRVNYCLFGSEIYILKSDGSYSLYTSPDNCSNKTKWNDGGYSIELIKSDSLSETERKELLSIMSSIFIDGQMLPVIEPNESVNTFWEAIDVYISVDDSEEAHVLKNYTSWEGYPQKEYDDLIEFLKSLDPDSIILNR